MARNRGLKRKRSHSLLPTPLDATPERLAMCESDWINPAELDSSEQPMGYTRRLKPMTRLDRWHRAQVITQRQYDAGNWYRTVYEAGSVEPRVVSSYGERTTGGENSYGLARTDRQLQARTALRQARCIFSREIVGFMDRLLLRDALPDFRGRRMMHTISEARHALDDLANYLKLG
jgi:hypothetical protein